MYDYEKIFAERGAAYHGAMCRAPAARAAEFEAAVRLAEPKRGEYLLDAPSGGGYLERYVPAGVCVVEVDPVVGFGRMSICVGGRPNFVRRLGGYRRGIE